MIHLCTFCSKPIKYMSRVVVLSSPTVVVNAVGSSIHVDQDKAKFKEQIVHEECLRQLLPDYDRVFREEELEVSRVESESLTEIYTEVFETLTQIGVEVDPIECRNFVLKSRVQGENKTGQLVALWFKRKKASV